MVPGWAVSSETVGRGFGRTEPGGRASVSVGSEGIGPGEGVRLGGGVSSDGGVSSGGGEGSGGDAGSSGSAVPGGAGDASLSPRSCSGTDDTPAAGSDADRDWSVAFARMLDPGAADAVTSSSTGVWPLAALAVSSVLL